MKPFKKKYYFIAFLLSCLFYYGCDENEIYGEGRSVELEDDTKVQLSYDILMTRGFVLQDLEDYGRLTNPEKTMLVPEISNANVHTLIDTEGNIKTTVDFKSHEYDIPKEAIGVYNSPEGLELSKIEISNENVTYYNLIGDVVGYGENIEEYDYLKNVIDEVSNVDHIKQEYFDAIMSAFKEQGYTVNDYGHLHGIEFVEGSGGKTEILIDKEFQAEVGYATFNNEGQIENTSFRVLGENEETGSTIVRAHVFNFPVVSPESKIMLNYEIRSKLSNYSLTINDK